MEMLSLINTCIDAVELFRTSVFSAQHHISSFLASRNVSVALYVVF